LYPLFQVYKRLVAVRRLSLQAFPGDVTVLLGRNGAGKTTLLRLITGMEQATEGMVLVAGHDVATDTDSARRSMGFCPQENILFAGLTLRRNEWALANTKIDDIMEAFSLDSKRDALASSLSWGMKRKLQLGVAIVGDPLTVVLDEPTSGADPECKGALWECVLRFHEDKTMLLTTHSMEEADTLGDRIAVIAKGRLRCCGSPMFLRTTYGTGYWIKASVKNFSQAKVFAQLVRHHVPQARIEADDHQTLNVNVGSPGMQILIELLARLNENRDSLLLETVSVTAGALEDVLRSRVEQGSEDMEQSNEGTPKMPDCPCALVDANKDCCKGARPMFKQRFGALLLKRFHYGRRDLKLPVLMILLPLSVLCLFVWINQTHISRALNYSGLLEYDLARLYGNTFVFYATGDSTQGDVGNAYARQMETEGGAKVVHLGDDVDPRAWLETRARENYQLYRNRYLIGATFETRNRTQIHQRAVIRGTEENDSDVVEVGGR
ncbi:unnamed protein product, partial [Ixodes hexagonus]